MSEPIPEKIITGFNRGDSSAFRVIYEHFYPEVEWLARRFVPQLDIAADITNKAFTKLWQYRGRVESYPAIRHFLYTVVKNAAIDALRHEKMVRQTLEELKEQLPGHVDPPEEKDWIEIRMLDLILQGIENLPKKCRTICRLAYVEEMDDAAIAQRLGISEKTVRNQRLIGLKRLRIQLRSTEK